MPKMEDTEKRIQELQYELLCLVPNSPFKIKLDAIHHWITSGQHYETGVILYEMMGSNQVLKAEFIKTKNSFTKSKLVMELKEIRNNYLALISA